jgi:hypothetical protein
VSARRYAAALAALCLAGCASTGSRSHVDLGPLRSAARSQLGAGLVRSAPPPGIALPALRATYSVADHGEQLTVLDFFDEADTATVLGGGRAPAGMTVLRRGNVVVLYSHVAGIDHSAAIRRALDAASLVSG